jgi:transcriptional regulator with XRE-family HTH domain
MGQLLEKVIRRKGINISELAVALNVTRRTIYNWFKQEVIDEQVMEKISNTISYDFSPNRQTPTVIKSEVGDGKVVKDEQYWQDRYVDLLERYSKLLIKRLP